MEPGLKHLYTTHGPNAEFTQQKRKHEPTCQEQSGKRGKHTKNEDGQFGQDNAESHA